jgi:hypothetical protein
MTMVKEIIDNSDWYSGLYKEDVSSRFLIIRKEYYHMNHKVHVFCCFVLVLFFLFLGNVQNTFCFLFFKGDGSIIIRRKMGVRRDEERRRIGRGV